jgi:hypothetical protein
VIRAGFRLAVLASLFTFASLANSALSWHLPLPDLIPKTEPAPQCVLPGTVPKTTPPGAATVTAYGDPAATGQPAGFGAVIPDLPSAMGKVQGQLLHKLDGPPPSQAQLQGVARAVGSGAARWYTSFRAAANGKDDPAQVTAYQDRQRAAFLAQNTTSCNPCQPGADGTPDPYNQTKFTTAAGTRLDAAQRAVAGTILTVGRARHVPDRGLVVAVAAAMQESKLRNLNHGDRDSLGVFQQRAGWGTPAQRMTPTYAAGKFYDALARVPGWQAMPLTVAAQRVQRSGYPGAYAQWEPLARAVVGGTGSAQTVGGGMECAAFGTAYKTTGNGGWGGYANGRIPPTALAHPRSAPRALFRPDAAAAFDQLNAAYRARFGVGIAVTDSYRDYATQVTTKAAKPGLAAQPGTSDHGWGLAADLGGGINRFGTVQYQWMKANAGRYGWTHEAWAEPGGSRPEPWHWTHVGKEAT